MLIHSIVNPDALFSVPETPIRSLRPWGSGWLEGYEQDGAFFIQRIISTSPADYLNPKLKPGEMMPYKQEKINSN